MTGDSLSDGVLRAGGFTERIKRPHPENKMKEIRGGEETSTTYGLYKMHSCLMEGH